MREQLSLTEAIETLVAQKRATGYKYVTEHRILARFEQFCQDYFPGVHAPTQAVVEAWVADAAKRAVAPSTLQSLVTPVRELARWLGRRGITAYILPAGILPRVPRYVPHIYTEQQLKDFFAQTDRCHYNNQVPVRHLVMPVLFRTIYACGLRCSEARLLRPDDVDIATGVLQIRDAKGGKDRQVPVAESLRIRLADYQARVAGRSDFDWFFPGHPGQPLTLSNIGRNFRRFLWQARISHRGRGYGPRIHDFRTSFAVHNLRNWFTNGDDIAALLPVLQTYMGHASINDTAYYLHLTAESYPDITARAQQLSSDIIPTTAGDPHEY